MENYEDYTKFMFEMGMLKRVQREGWKLLGITNPESVAEHSLRAAQIGFLLANLEGYENPEKICTMLVFHDIAECRIGDIHKVANRYVSVNQEQVVNEQLKSLDHIGLKIHQLWDEIEQQKTTAGIIAKDADLLEMIVTACETRTRYGVNVDSWISNTKKRLQTQSAKKMLSILISIEPNNWWKSLKKI
jgi:putative hydrolases of HD superfamily